MPDFSTIFGMARLATPKNTKIIKQPLPQPRPLLLIGAPHWGHAVAFLLTCFPHSLQLTSAIKDPDLNAS
jgi:hypothetical protein